MSLGSKIQQIRKEHGLSQEQFADQFHVTRQTVSNWENNRNYPDITSLRQISESFGISFDTLLKEDEAYLKRVDDSVKKVPVLKRLLLALLGILLVAVVAFAVILHNAFQATEDGARINSDTLVRMTVNLRDSSPSRAITYTAESENAKTEAYKKAVLGKIEGISPWCPCKPILRWFYIFRTMIIRISGRSWSGAYRESSGTGQAIILHGSGMIWHMSRREVI